MTLFFNNEWEEIEKRRSEEWYCCDCNKWFDIGQSCDCEKIWEDNGDGRKYDHN